MTTQKILSNSSFLKQNGKARILDDAIGNNFSLFALDVSRGSLCATLLMSRALPRPNGKKGPSPFQEVHRNHRDTEEHEELKRGMK